MTVRLLPFRTLLAVFSFGVQRFIPEMSNIWQHIVWVSELALVTDSSPPYSQRSCLVVTNSGGNDVFLWMCSFLGYVMGLTITVKTGSRFSDMAIVMIRNGGDITSNG